ncbi:alpha/beta hydrolase-fold protein [Leptodesmis sp.]|uniref:alpha/beta hydrolase-fold protein n=1 Tax=Leptodesmis sp. TaxID=3100501 RepID=UPI00405357FD
MVCALRNGDRYRSVSAFSPIVAPMRCPWGQKAFSHYLGTNQENWHVYDASSPDCRRDSTGLQLSQ